MTPIERARALRRDYDDLTRQAQESGHYSDPPAEMVASPALPSVDHWQIVRFWPDGRGLIQFSAHLTAGSSQHRWNASTRPGNGHGRRTTCSGFSDRLTRSTVLVKPRSPP